MKKEIRDWKQEARLDGELWYVAGALEGLKACGRLGRVAQGTLICQDAGFAGAAALDLHQRIMAFGTVCARPAGMAEVNRHPYVAIGGVMRGGSLKGNPTVAGWQSYPLGFNLVNRNPYPIRRP